jgi:hypothetical protein
MEDLNMKPKKGRLRPVLDVCDLLWKQIERPKNIIECRAINVYDNKYRINIYTKHHDSLYDLDRVRITQSYFAKLDGEQLVIKHEKL